MKKVLIMATGAKDFSPAKKYGELTPITLGSTNLLAHERHEMDILKVMLSLDEKPYILVSGHHLIPGLMLLCSCMIWGEADCLIFDSKTRTYSPITVSLNNIKEAIKSIKGI